MKKDHYYYDAYNKTIAYIMKHQRCTSEIEKYLEKFELSKEDGIKIINHLKSIGLINDNIYVKSYISDAINLTKDGPYKIKRELLDNHIDESIIDEEISKIDEDVIIDKMLKIISKKFKANHKYSKYQFKQKVSLEMVNLGYDRELADSLIDNFDFEEDDLLKQEYDKLYNKLSRKYEGYELESKIKQKLYAKGFDINKINSLMN
jgi:regulatory protein